MKKQHNKFSSLYPPGLKSSSVEAADGMWCVSRGEEEVARMYGDAFCDGNMREAEMQVRKRVKHPPRVGDNR